MEWHSNVEEKKKIEENKTEYDNRRYLRELYWERDIVDSLKFDENEISLIQNNMLIVSGRAGTGKSQLFAREALDNIDDDCEAVLLLGEYFIEDSYVSEQIIKKLGLDCNLKEFFCTT